MPRDQKGFTLLAVMIVILMLVAVGIVMLDSVDDHVEEHARFKRRELSLKAAEVAISHRLAEVAAMREPAAILDPAASNLTAWQPWPPVGHFTSAPDTVQRVQYQAPQTLMLWRGTVPPPGVAVGTNTYIFSLTGTARPTTDPDPMLTYESSVEVGIKTWDALPSSYGP